MLLMNVFLFAAHWWESFGGQCPQLQKFAIRILSQTCSASGCERNWSVFERIHTKKRNRLEHKQLNDLVFVQYNLRLRRNQLMSKTPNLDPIVLDDIDPTKVVGECLPLIEPAHGAHSLEPAPGANA